MTISILNRSAIGSTGRRLLSLHHLVAPDVSAVELVRIAAKWGCAHVCLFTQEPDAGVRFPILPAGEIGATRREMDATGITALGVTSFVLKPDTDVAAFSPGLEAGEWLGAAVANMRILDEDETRVVENFGRFAELAAQFGLRAGIEPTGYRNSVSLARALRIIAGAGNGGGISIDALHVVRTDTELADIAALDPALVAYVQICDGPIEGSEELYAQEGAFDRLPPGEGEFPLEELLSFIPAALPLSLEVPCTRWKLAGVDADERARRVIDAARRFLGEADGSASPVAVD